jgi:hypothetical protein
MGSRPKPEAMCTRCGDFRLEVSYSNQQCAKRPHGKQCRGIYRSSIGTNDCKECDRCGGTGDPAAKDNEIGARRCIPCKGRGGCSFGRWDSEATASSSAISPMRLDRFGSIGGLTGSFTSHVTAPVTGHSENGQNRELAMWGLGSIAGA